MKKIVHSALAVALLLGAGAAHAQITFGPKVGINLANVKYKLSDADKKDGAKEPDTQMKIGASFGLMMNARFGNLAIQPALTYSMKGYKLDEKVDETTTQDGFTTTSKGTSTGQMSLGYIDIPVNLVYTTGGDQGFQVFAGPYVGFGMGGKYEFDSKVTSTTSFGGQQIASSEVSFKGDGDVEFKSEVTRDDAKKEKTEFVRQPDFGINAGIGYLMNRFQVQAGYGLGLNTLIPDYEGDTTSDSDKSKLTNRVIHVTVAYHFGGE